MGAARSGGHRQATDVGELVVHHAGQAADVVHDRAGAGEGAAQLGARRKLVADDPHVVPRAEEAVDEGPTEWPVGTGHQHFHGSSMKPPIWVLFGDR